MKLLLLKLKAKYYRLKTEIYIKKYETGKDSDLDGLDGCEAGACPVR